MNVYIVNIDDRHSNISTYVFADPDKAMEFAKAEALDLCRDETYFEEMTVHGWLYYATYSCEGDCVWVVEKELR